MECSIQRMKWYKDTGETGYLVDSEMYLRVANIYMQNISSKDSTEHPNMVTNETC